MTMQPDGPVLRDIHVPPAPPWWPPAPGWWLLAALVLMAIATGVMVWRSARRRRRRCDRVLAEVDMLAALHGGDTQLLATGLHQLLRRVARKYDPTAARLRGEAWREALARVPVAADTLHRLLALEQAMYRPLPYDTDATLSAVRDWLRAALASEQRRVRRA
ncbi:MAG TPA: DUF4381 family protein [Frateuria sp.]|uniref:DUF4381 family protein n=1 Tax=Frateuria sp. TaxID=2211372 RepID=UPI002DF06C32|nr:DUF4381 family protein [Frateuria sp.]